jgi:mono/diheme cytochrome c family protein
MRVQRIGPRIGTTLVMVLLYPNLSVAGDPSRGFVLSRQWCSGCHGITPGEGSPSAEAPRFVDVAAEPSATEYSLRVFLRTPHPTMPNFVLNTDDIEDLASYIVSLKKRQ